MRLRVRTVDARPVMVPLARPIRTASGTIGEAPLLLIDHHTDQGVTGRAYLFGSQPATLDPLRALVRAAGAAVAGEGLAPQELHRTPGPCRSRHDCADGFVGAYWRRPAAYLDPAVRGAMSTFARIDVEAGLARLRRDLDDGRWARRHAELPGRDECDLGDRLVIAPGGGS